MPVLDVLVGHTRRHVKHENRTVTLDVVSITETAKLRECGEKDATLSECALSNSHLLLTGRVPHVEADGA